MLQAWIVLPALAAGYLVTAPLPVRRWMRDLAIAGTVMQAISLSWIAVYTFTPTSDRPNIDGSTNNSAIAMVFGYNELERFGVHTAYVASLAPTLAALSAAGIAILWREYAAGGRRQGRDRRLGREFYVAD